MKPTLKWTSIPTNVELYSDPMILSFNKVFESGIIIPKFPHDYI